VDAKKRGVDVVVLLDKTQLSEPHTEADFLSRAGIPTFIDTAHASAHSKVIVIDGGTVITGSFNFTKAAEEHNAENMLVIHDTALALKYAANWESHKAHSMGYTSQ
jgi:phosphatidylserine/phosphatidylglycerophosphate/cardiolipin synthase-like enzyme